MSVFNFLKAKQKVTITSYKESLVHCITRDNFRCTKKAIEEGADLNILINNGGFCLYPLELADKNYITNLLKEYGAICSPYSEIAWDFLKQEVIDQYPFGLVEFYKNIVKNLAATKAEINKIPYTSHQIWLTHSSSPKEIDASDISTIIHNTELLNAVDQKWKHIIWTNDKSLIPNSISSLEKQGLEFRDIQEIKGDIELFETVLELADKKLFGMASDILRYSIVEYFGGVYLDLNFKLSRTIEDDLYRYDFFAQSFVNNIFAARPNHPILSALLDKIKSNFLNPPSYLQSIDESDILMQTAYTTLLPFGLSYLKASNKGANIDIIYPSDDAYEDDKSWLYEQKKCATIGTLLEFNQNLGISRIEGLELGEDGTEDGPKLSWLLDKETCYMGSDYKLQICKFDSVFDAGF